MAGMFLAGSAVFLSFGVGTILVVAVAVLGSVTVLPAMLSWLGQKGWTEKGRVPYISAAAPSQPRRVARVGSDPRPRPQAPRDLRGAGDAR